MHVSFSYIQRVDEIAKVGDEVKVKVVLIDDTGRIKLSRKFKRARVYVAGKSASRSAAATGLAGYAFAASSSASGAARSTWRYCLRQRPQRPDRVGDPGLQAVGRDRPVRAASEVRDEVRHRRPRRQLARLLRPASGREKRAR